ncbi:MAG: hypothetical protein R3F53_01860 [Gammaproteobacteria bacterium]
MHCPACNIWHRSAAAPSPSTGCRSGCDTLVIYDDLSTHAKTYRELSLRCCAAPPGREAYPPVMFSVHACLLERSTCLNAPTAVAGGRRYPLSKPSRARSRRIFPRTWISITDGQVYLDQNLFAGGFRPAIDIAQSARALARAAPPASKPRLVDEAGLSAVSELKPYPLFGAWLEANMEQAIKRGRLLREILKQDRLAPCR